MLPIDNAHTLQAAKDTFLDSKGLNSIKAMGRDDDPQALKEVAKKFEALFVQQMLKTMRAANEVFSEGSYLNSNETKFHQDMLDQQMSLDMTSGRGLGLADALYQQMQRAYGETDASQPEAIKSLDEINQPTPVKNLSQMVHHQQMLMSVMDAEQANEAESANPFTNQFPGVARSAPSADQSNYSAVSTKKGGKTSVAESPADFVNALRPYAEKAAEKLQVNADVLLAQAALETGWGKHVIHTRDGDNSFNLFNIKAGSRWQGDSVNVSTVEYRNGTAKQEQADFRRYDNYAESFSDYVNLLQSHPRYEQALKAGDNSAAYAEALQDAGYATDPEYAEKIKQLLNSDSIRAAAETLVTFVNNDVNET